MDFRVPKLIVRPKGHCIIHTQRFLGMARAFHEDGKVTKAYECYAKYFDTLSDPNAATDFDKAAYTELVCEIGILLEDSDNMEELLKCYIKAINMFPSNYVILNCLGYYMYKIHEINIAKKYLEASCYHSNNRYLPAEKNLLYIKWYEVPRWHFRMMNDKRRNFGYYLAIKTALVSGKYKRVIDIGAGCGFLSYAAGSNRNVVVRAVEENKSMYELCSNAMKSIQLDNVSVDNINSTEIISVNQRFDFLVTEIFDVALFGEHALKTIVHAHRVFLTEDDFHIVPSRGHVYVTGVESLKLCRKYRYCGSIPEIKLAKMCVTADLEEPYEADYMKDYNVSYITNTRRLFHINFYDLKEINKIINDPKFKTDVVLECTSDGTIHALVIWFSLDLGYGAVITTNPRVSDCLSCWEQAVFYLDHPVEVKKGDLYTITANAFNNRLTVALLNNPSDCTSCIKVAREIVQFLNDTELVRTIVKFADKYTDKNLTVVDFNVFPLFGILLAKKGIRGYFICRDELYAQLVENLLKLNDISEDVFTVIKIFSYPMNIKKVLMKSDLVFIEPISVEGTLNIYPLEIFPKIVEKIVPKRIKLNAVLINSTYIDNCNKVDEENTFGFKIAQFMNEYTGNEHPNLDNFEYDALSSVSTVDLDWTSDDFLTTSRIKVTKSGRANAILYWYNIVFHEDISYSTLKSTYYKKCCSILDKPKALINSQEFTISIKVQQFNLKLVLND